MTPRRVQLLCSATLVVCLLLYAAPVHAALESAGLLDRASQHFQQALSKWSIVLTNAAIRLFWMLAAITLVWELGNLALRGASMEAAVAWLMRFVFFLGLWLYILSHASAFGILIIDSLRQLGAQASGLSKDLMPSKILDIGFSILWKTMKFVVLTGGYAPIVASAALVIAVAILLLFAHTAINMFLLVVSQWFLLYGGIFFVGFGIAPWGSEEAKNYLRLCLSIGAQLMAMAALVGLGESFIQKQYAELSGSTGLGELVVILLVAVMMCRLANEIPRMFARFTPTSYAPQGVGYAAMFGAMTAAGAALAASAAMAKGAAATMVGAYKAASAAMTAAKALQSSPPPTPRSQTGVSSSGGGSIGAARTGGAEGGERAATRTQGPLATMLANTGIGGPGSAAGAAANARGGTSTAATKPAGADAQKPPASPPNGQPTGDDAAARAPAKQTQEAQARGADSGTASSDSSAKRAASSGAGTAAQAHAPGAASGSEPHEAAAESETGAQGQDDQDEREAVEGEEHGPTQSAGAGSDEPSQHGDEASSLGEEHGATSAAAPEPSAAQGGGDAAAAADPSSTAAGQQSAASAGASAGAETGAAAAAPPAPAAASGTTSAAATSAASTASATGATDPGAASGAPASASGGSSAATSVGAPSAPAPAATGAASGGGAASAAADSGGAGPSAASPGAGSARPPESSSSTQSGSSAAPDPGGPSADVGGQRGSTSIAPAPSRMDTYLTAAKILGKTALQQQRNAFMSRADATAGGQIAAAIRKKYELDKKPEEDAGTDKGELAPRASTAAAQDADQDTASAAPQARTARSNHPADWVTGDELMTDNQWHFLRNRLGDEVDPDMTKAEASMLIDELLHEDEG